MTSEMDSRVEEFFAGFANGVASLLLLDYDGTLAPFHVDRFQAYPFAGVREVIARIQEQSLTRIAVITGRPAREILPLLHGAPVVVEQPVEVWGLHGAERLHADGRYELEQIAPETRRALDEVHEHLRANDAGGELEVKPNAAVMHWRGALPQVARLIEQCTREIFEPFAAHPDLKLLEFESGLELRAGRNKGDAVRALAAEVATGTPIAFLGDDWTDEPAFRAVNEYEGPRLSVLVRPELRDTEAAVWVRPPDGLLAFLERWLDAVPKNREHEKAPAILQAHD